jgi:hypothetical protein
MFNRSLDGLATFTPVDHGQYDEMGVRMARATRPELPIQPPDSGGRKGHPGEPMTQHTSAIETWCMSHDCRALAEAGACPQARDFKKIPRALLRSRRFLD